MVVRSVIDTETQTRYSTGETVLGEGATARVWLGVDTSDPQRTIAVKIAHRGTVDNRLADFWAEITILNRLSATPAHDQVPWAHKGQSPDDPDAAIILMENIGNQFRLSGFVRASDRKLPERIFLITALQYATLLVALHELRYTTRGDRKTTDLRLINSESVSRLVVLDWNRARAIPNDASPQMSDELMRQDLRGFGQLWAELTLGRRVTTLHGIDETDDTDWAAVPRGLRIILARAVGARVGWGYQSATELLGDLKRYVGLIKSGQTGGSPALLNQARDLKRQAESSRGSVDHVALVDLVLTVSDLALRLAEGADVEAAAELSLWAGQQASALLKEATEATRQIQQRLTVLDHEGALQVAQAALKRCSGKGLEPQRAYLRVARWGLIAEAGVRGDELRQHMRTPLRSLSDSLARLEQNLSMASSQPPTEIINSILGIASEMQAASASLPSPAQAIIAPLIYEVDTRLFLAQSRQAEASPEEARQRAGQAINRWRTIEGVNPIYATCMRTDSPDLDLAIARESSHDELRRAGQGDADYLDAAVTALHVALGEEGLWRDLDDELRQAREHLRRMQEIGELDKPTLAAAAMITLLGVINDLFIAGQSAAAVTRAATGVPEMSLDLREILTGRAVRAARADLDNMVHRALWPDEVDAARTLVRTLRSLPGSAGLDTYQLDDLEQHFDMIVQFREKIREKLSAYLDLTDNPEAILRNLDEPHIDTTLEEIRSNYVVELYDRPRISGDDASYRVETLLAARRSKRLLLDLERLAGNLETLATHLRGEAGMLQGSLSASDEALRHFQTVEIAMRRPEITEQIAQAEAYVGKLRALGERVRTANDSAAKISTLVQSTAQQEQDVSAIMQRQEDVKRRIKQADVMETEIANALSFIERAQSFPMTQSQAVLATLINTQVLAGFQAVRALQLEGEGGAAEWLNHAKIWAERSGFKESSETKIILGYLEQAVRWLSALSRDPQIYDALSRYSDAIYARDLGGADQAWSDFLRTTAYLPKLRNSWLIAELRAEHTLLRSDSGGGSSIPPAPESDRGGQRGGLLGSWRK
ncbi:MAG: hypothetical protein WCF99_03075 [Chloroflexales bacterium]